MPVPLFSGWTKIYEPRAQATGPLCVRNGQTLGNGIPLYFYTANHAAVNVTAGTTYFVEIRNTGGDTTGSSGCHWRWAWSVDGTLLYSVEQLEGQNNYFRDEDPENAMNLAYGLDIEIEQMELIPPPPEDPPPPPPPP
ncbi:MAG: hypothetical protein IID30_15680, partial [Planctomycetes bacterium]|nr:hypothetical protein [Planctomycetota bacterium]